MNLRSYDVSKPNLISRRGVIRAAAAATAMFACPVIAKAKPRVVVVSGGAGG
ncbi:NAD(P)/FAD-dependent oxidoreductase, partial [Rhodopseudomonas sp. BR0C11]|nr:NAD(P)/FAD-dependent oxidoreductase [Rhodopseudomonas sp. BR0C11]